MNSKDTSLSTSAPTIQIGCSKAVQRRFRSGCRRLRGYREAVKADVVLGEIGATEYQMGRCSIVLQDI